MAQAGAWPRDAGTAFIAVSADQTRAQIYAEYGLRGDWTLGMEVTMPRGRRKPDLTQFIQHPVWRGAGGAIVSAGLAVELRETTAAQVFPSLKGEAEIALRAGLFWGKGFDTPLGNGWATLDAQAETIATTDWLATGPTYKLDAGLGIKPRKGLMLMGQAQYWRRGAEQSLRLESSAAWDIGRAQLVLSPSIGVIGARDPRLKLGLWVTF